MVVNYLHFLVLSLVFCFCSTNPLHFRSANYERQIRPAFQNGVFNFGFQLNIPEPLIGFRLTEMKNTNKYFGSTFNAIQSNLPMITSRTGATDTFSHSNNAINERDKGNQKDARFSSNEIPQKNKEESEDISTENTETTSFTTDEPSTTESTYETTTDSEYTTSIYYDDELFNRSGVSSQLLASLVG
ncbi:uncharacterized protein LOC114244785 isoform X1 [Bombyx mandarina]|uniref:Uncharacterized protein LOC114244785 isoform X1 n=1 Tax=Bombyx mandarina TaxID=7092 RepID=A0A6J2JT82_BOMMA|nr:uncharacterized protein LOC114244785 isoform X1 [Bombyx mandarina]